MKCALRRRGRLFAALAFAGSLLSVAGDLRAETPWDLGIGIGPMKRFLALRTPGGDDAGFGAIADLHGHVAVLPPLRLGGYVSHDISPQGPAAARQITSFGPRLKYMPVYRGSLRWWALTGFGYSRTQAPSYHQTLPIPSGTGQPVPSEVTVDSASGGFFEVPIGAGMGTLIGRRWMLEAELIARIGLGHHGAVYDLGAGREGHAPNGLPLGLDTPGLDRFALGLTFGVSYQP